MLKREFGRWDLVLLIINGIVGAGIFGLPAKIFALSGVYSLLAMLFCAVIICCVVLVFAEVASRFKKTGGPYLFALKTLGPLPAFVVGWLLFLSRLTAYAALINLMVTYLSIFSENFSEPIIRISTILLVTFSLMLINYKGVKNAKIASNILTVTKMFTLLVFILVGSFFVDLDLFDFGQTEFPSISNFSSSVLFMVFAFTGFEATLVNAGEMKDPKRNIPFALIVSILIIAVFYLAIQVVCIGTLPNLATSEKPLAEAAFNFSGNWGAKLISSGAVVSILGTLNAIMLVGTRLPYAMSKAKQLPKVLKRLHKKHFTPDLSIWIFTLIVTWVSVSGSFYYALGVSVITKILIIALTAWILIKQRKIYPATKGVFILPKGIFLAYVVIVVSIWLLFNSNKSELRDVFIAVAFGLIIYFLERRWRSDKKP